ncbi:M1 family metallopeptidase [soil metagenome]
MHKLFSVVILLLVVQYLFSQTPIAGLDVQHYRFALQLNDSNNIIKGEAVITTRFIKPVDKVSFDLAQKQDNEKGMIVTSVRKNDKAISFTQDAQHIIINDAAGVSDENRYTIFYEGIPANGLIIGTNKYGHRTFFADNWPSRAHNWIPCNDHPSDKASVEFIVTAPEHYQVISNGIQTEETNLPNHLKLTHYKEEVLLPTKVMVIGAADFAVNYAGTIDEIPVYSWVYPEDRDTGFKSYAAAKSILPWFEKNVGAYPYKKLANVQSKTIFGGMENANAIFYFENSVTDKKLEALLVHEIAHQWFGNSASEKDWSHLWLSEGFATYMTHLYHEEKYGIDSFNNRLKEDRKKIITFSKNRNTPVSDTSASGNLMQLLNANSYEKGGWVLHMLRRKVGDSLFRQSIRTYYDRYKGSNANSDDLRNVFEDISNQSLEEFFQQWIYTAGQPELDIKWNYNKKEKEISLVIVQQQERLFTFSLDLMIDNSILKTAGIKNKTTTISFAYDIIPTSIEVDPKVNLLFTALVHKGK